MVVTQQKLCEKLTVLQHRGNGMLTRIYNIKKACSDQKSKPAFLSDKSLEGAVKYIQRRFPNTDTKSLSSIQPLRNEGRDSSLACMPDGIVSPSQAVVKSAREI